MSKRNIRFKQSFLMNKVIFFTVLILSISIIPAFGQEIIGQKIAVQVSIDNSFAFKLPIDSDIEIKNSYVINDKNSNRLIINVF